MMEKYHILVSKLALKGVFSPLALEEIIRSNIGQDRFLKKVTPRFHFDNDISAGLAFIVAERAKIEDLCNLQQGHKLQRAILGRICHAVQDFYSHTNYVDLWLKTHGGLKMTDPGEIEALDEAILNHWHSQVRRRFVTFSMGLPNFHFFFALDSWVYGLTDYLQAYDHHRKD
jgi:hypothetical protein